MSQTYVSTYTLTTAEPVNVSTYKEPQTGRFTSYVKFHTMAGTTSVSDSHLRSFDEWYRKMVPTIVVYEDDTTRLYYRCACGDLVDPLNAIHDVIGDHIINSHLHPGRP